jgi:outer membrane protein assembly factor BamB
MFQRCLGSTFILLGLATVTTANDWPQWHGPKRDAICTETGLLKTWPKDGPPIVWKAKQLGGGYSAPSIAAGVIYGMSYRKGDEVVWALKESDGSPLWTQRIADPGKAGYNEGPRCTPTVDGDFVYALGVSGELACLNTKDGKIVWHKNFTSDFGGKVPRWGYSESPLIDGDNLICTPGGNNSTLIALNKMTGAVVWKCAVPGGDGAAYSSIVISEAAGTRQYVALLGRGIVGVRAKDGKFLWRYNRVANGTANIPTPIVEGNYVFCSTGYGTGSALLELKADGDSVKVNEKYFLGGKELQNHHGGLVHVGDYVYGGHGHGDGIPICLDMMKGKFAWHEERGLTKKGSAAVLYADGMLYFHYQDGLMALVEATPKAFKKVSSFQLPDKSGKNSWSHPVIANGRMYVRDQDTLLCFDVKQSK